MLVLRTPKGWTCPPIVDGVPVEGTWRSHQVPMTDVRTNPDHLRVLEATDARGDYPFPVYFTLRLITTTLAVAAIAVIALASGYRGATLALILAVGLAKACEAVSDVVFGLLQEAENLRRIALSMLWPA